MERAEKERRREGEREREREREGFRSLPSFSPQVRLRAGRPEIRKKEEEEEAGDGQGKRQAAGIRLWIDLVRSSPLS